MLPNSAGLAVAVAVFSQLASSAPSALTSSKQGAAGCMPSQTQPYAFTGVLVVKGDSGYADESSAQINYLAPQQQYDGNDYLFYRRDINSVYKGSSFDGAVATPCDAFRSKVTFSGYGYSGVDAYEVGILRRTTNRKQCAQMIPYVQSCQNSICPPDPSYSYKKRAGDENLQERMIFGSGWDIRWVGCPKTDEEVLANGGQFLFAWLYNGTAQAQISASSNARKHSRVFVHRANEINNAFARNGYSLGDRMDGSAVLVGTAYKTNTDPIQLITAYDGNPNKTQAEVIRQTKPIPLG
ncbi:hypothetical protein A4X13_0g5697 [Tilletia indica]|uniref:Secreted protein n=1 Tax=Tilletia indica TaxID=43049 RepID=A0A8T8ST11_9BASI|nr:hypothetical protein A4X13_0g5697 [Tilletia indica]